MSPRRLDPNIRLALIEAAARLIAEEGPAGLSTRRLATEAGTSTMAAYTLRLELAPLKARLMRIPALLRFAIK